MFSKRLRDLRKKNRMTQVQFAQEFNISNGTIAMWETGKREPDFNTIQRIADYFGVTLDYLLDHELPKENLTVICETKQNQNSQPPIVFDEGLTGRLQAPYMQEIHDVLLQVSPESRKLILAQIAAVKSLEDDAKK